MLLISHRGNIVGPDPVWENNPTRVMEVIYAGYDVEVDLWETDSGYYLGHDQPKYKIDYWFLINKHLWVHCKHIEVFVNLMQDSYIHCFYHKDDVSLTTKGYIITEPGKYLGYKSIAAMPEFAPEWDISSACGVCSDYIVNYETKSKTSI